MTEHVAKLDLAQRIAEALSRTSEPLASVVVDDSNQKDGEIIGSVPLHLRHLHNLYCELLHEKEIAEIELHQKTQGAILARAIFIYSIMSYVPAKESSIGIAIKENWDMFVNYPSKESV